jgi:Mn2+/Fe2+ NRAMP family transporter
VATAGNSRLTADFLALSGIWRHRGPAGRDRVVNVFCVVYPSLALALYFLFREPRTLVLIGGYAQGLMLPLISGATLYLRYRDADARVAPSRVTDLFTWIAAVTITLVALYSLYNLVIEVMRWLGRVF